MPLSKRQLKKLEAELARLERLQDQTISKTENNLSLVYARHLNDVQADAKEAYRAYSGALTGPKLARARLSILKTQDAPLRKIWNLWKKDLDLILEDLERYHNALGTNTKFDPRIIESLKGVWPSGKSPQGLIGNLYNLDQFNRRKYADILTRSIVSSIPRRNVNKAIVDSGIRGKKRAQALAHDGTMLFTRQVNAARSTEYEYFQYSGPIDKVTRPFCEKHTNKIKTRRAWAALENGQTDNPFLTGGGYRCRHVLRPVRRDWFTEEEWNKRTS